MKTLESIPVLQLILQCVGDANVSVTGERSWLGVVGVVDTRLV